MVLEKHGWKLLYHSVFGDHYRELRERVRGLKARLPERDFREHPDAKLAAAIRRVILEIIPQDPNRADFWLRRELGHFRRVKGHGLPDRHRLFYVFSKRARTVIVLYLNDSSTLRKEGSKTDPYEVFRQLVAKGKIGKDFAQNYEEWEKARSGR